MQAGTGVVRAGAAVKARAAMLTLAALAPAGCAHLSPHWPWHHSPASPAAPVHALDISDAAGGDTFPQYWKRNTLLVDLSAASGSGSITLKPASGSDWPVRLAFRVTPGAVGVLEVRAAERATFAVTAGGKPVDLELAPGIYTPQTPQMAVSWGPAAPASAP